MAKHKTKFIHNRDAPINPAFVFLLLSFGTPVVLLGTLLGLSFMLIAFSSTPPISFINWVMLPGCGLPMLMGGVWLLVSLWRYGRLIQRKLKRQAMRQREQERIHQIMLAEAAIRLAEETTEYAEAQNQTRQASENQHC